MIFNKSEPEHFANMVSIVGIQQFSAWYKILTSHFPSDKSVAALLSDQSNFCARILRVAQDHGIDTNKHGMD